MLSPGFNGVSTTVAMNHQQFENGNACGRCVKVTGTGAGSRVMEALAAAADQQGMPLRLTPSGKRNITFYERFGFTVGRTAHDTAMHRTPRRR